MLAWSFGSQALGIQLGLSSTIIKHFIWCYFINSYLLIICLYKSTSRDLLHTVLLVKHCHNNVWIENLQKDPYDEHSFNKGSVVK
jgi:hypothetical protein